MSGKVGAVKLVSGFSLFLSITLILGARAAQSVSCAHCMVEGEGGFCAAADVPVPSHSRDGGPRVERWPLTMGEVFF